MQALELGLLLKVAGIGAAQAALRSLGGSMDGLRRHTDAARREHLRLGREIESLSSRGREVDGLRQRYDMLGRAIAQARLRARELNAALADQQKHAQAIANLKGDAIAVVGMAAPAIGAVRQAATFGDAVKDIAITGELSRDAERQLGASLRAIALNVNQTAEDMARGVNLLIANGMEADKAARQAELLGRFTTATRASFEDAASIARPNRRARIETSKCSACSTTRPTPKTECSPTRSTSNF